MACLLQNEQNLGQLCRKRMFCSFNCDFDKSFCVYSSRFMNWGLPKLSRVRIPGQPNLT